MGAAEEAAAAKRAAEKAEAKKAAEEAAVKKAAAEKRASETTEAKKADAVPSAEVPTKQSKPTLSQMVSTIREQLELDAWTYDTPPKVIAEANRQLGLPAVGTIAEQARS